MSGGNEQGQFSCIIVDPIDRHCLALGTLPTNAAGVADHAMNRVSRCTGLPCPSFDGSFGGTSSGWCALVGCTRYVNGFS